MQWGVAVLNTLIALVYLEDGKLKSAAQKLHMRNFHIIKHPNSSPLKFLWLTYLIIIPRNQTWIQNNDCSYNYVNPIVW